VNVAAFLRRHAAVVWLATLVFVAVGVKSASSIPSSIYPEVEFPRIVVVARAGGAPPDVFLTTVTRPLEQTLTSVLGLQRIRSKTIRGATEISLQFAPSTDMWRALQMVESRTSQSRQSLPAGAELLVERITTGSFPIVTFNVSGALDPRELREVAEFVVRPALANVPGVGAIEVLGGDVREMEVILDPEALASLHLTPSDVAERLQSGMGLTPVGRVDRDRQLVTVVHDAQPKDLAAIRDMPLFATDRGNVATLGQVSEVVEGAEDRTARVGGPYGPTVSVSLARLPGASTTDVVDRASAAVDAVRPSLPPGITVRPVYDQASLVHESMNGVRDAILLGIALCAAVIALFLGDLRAGLLAAATVPITLAIGFALMRAANQTLNLMSLGGMAVAIGLVVDDAIVVVEAIARHRGAGADRVTAAARGTAELAPAVIGTTLTTVVVFVPLTLLDGVVGDFFKALAFTVTSAVLVSLPVALIVVPLAAERVLSVHVTERPSRLSAVYDRVVRRLVHRPLVAGLGLGVVCVAGAAVVPFVGRGFLPTMDESAFVLDYFLPAGTSMAATETFARRLEALLKAVPEVRNFTRRTGAELGPAAATEASRGDVMVRLSRASTRARSSDEVVADVRARIERTLPEVRVEFVQVLQDVLNDLSGSPRPIEVKLFGPDYGELRRLAGELAGKLGDVPGLVDLYDGREREAPELRFTPDRAAVARAGFSADDIAKNLDTALRGAVVGAVRRFDRLVGVRVRFPNPIRFDAERVLDLPLSLRDHPTTFGSVTEATMTTSTSLLLHEALQPMIAVTADTEGRDLGSVASDVEKRVASLRLGPGYRAVMGGQVEAQKETLRNLGGIGAMALLLVLTVLAAQFRRFHVALLVLVSVPVAMVGALVALYATRIPLNASSLMGCVLLVGLVVKNGVLLLEQAERFVDDGATGLDAVIRASEQRFRPVVMTTVATLAGLLPLALGIGSGAELQRPLAVAVIGGLITSTVATLGFLPPLAAALFARSPRSSVGETA
jgi:CzcA family heavy metal efflux pump